MPWNASAGCSPVPLHAIWKALLSSPLPPLLSQAPQDADSEPEISRQEVY